MPTRPLEIPDTGSERKAADCALAGADERRSSGRTTTLYRTGLLATASDSGLCTVRNICDTGMMVVTPMELARGDMVQISLSETVTLRGHVAWREGSRVGIELVRSIDVAALLQGLAAEHRMGFYRARRLAVNAGATLTGDQGVQTVQVSNISQRGMQVSHDGSLGRGDLVTVSLAYGLERRGVVRWTNGRLAGLRLTDPIPIEQLARGSEVSRRKRVEVGIDGPPARPAPACNRGRLLSGRGPGAPQRA